MARCVRFSSPFPYTPRFNFMLQIDERDLKSLLSWIGSALFTVLFLGNIYFMKRLVDKLDITEQNVIGLGKDVIKLKVKICAIEKFKLGISEDIDHD